MEAKIERFSLAKCKAVLLKDGSEYSDAEILEIRDFLYKLADMDYEVFLKEQKRDDDFLNEELKQAA